MSSEFLPTTLVDFILIGSGLATMVLVLILWHQIRQTETSMRLAYGAVIHGRYTRRIGNTDQFGYPRLLIANIGNGPALDLDLKIKTPDGKTVLETVKRFSLTPDDPTHGTKIDLSKYPEVLFVGTYKDANRKIQKIQHIIQYPLMQEVKEEKISKEDPDELN